MQREPWYIPPAINPQEKRAVVIGGGLAGTHAAYSLAKRGWSVAIIERENHLAPAASGNPFGIIAPLITHKEDPIGEFYARGFAYSIAHFKDLSNTSLRAEGAAIQKSKIPKLLDYHVACAPPNDVLFTQCGVLELSKSKIIKNLQGVVPVGEVAAVSQYEAVKLSGVELPSNALYIKNGGYANPAALCRANIAAWENIEVIYSQEILSLQKCDGGWALLNRAGGEVASAQVVIIANAADAKIIPQCSYIPLHRVRGQLTYLPGVDLGLKKVLCYDGGYIIPQIDGVSYIGATYSRTNLSSDICEADHEENIGNLEKGLFACHSERSEESSLSGSFTAFRMTMSDIKTPQGRVSFTAFRMTMSDIKTPQGRVSFRATLPDRRPVIGAIPDISAFNEDYADLHHGRKYKEYPPGKYLEGLYILTGFGSRGLSACPIAGEFLAAMINNEEAILPPHIADLLSPARFVVKGLRGGERIL